MNEWAGLADALRIGGWVVYPLSVLAVIALTIMLDRAYVFWRHASGRVGAAPTLPDRHVMQRLAVIFDHGATPLWHVEAKLEAAAQQIERDMSRGLWLLETIVTAAPLLGLLGTIVGMMHSFRLIGGDGLVSPAGVSGGIAQALVATAIGLVIALVSLFAFNYFSRRVDRLMDDLESLANERLAELRLAREQAGASS
ncbi:MotA/TolQ/ExbB proton channel family protein [Burkholderia metallica]|uniref:MotA/TolQ/ExbB proton channel family protein n=1 Tax=Burkholderia metallica TaxID=488729 RepID=A0ABT8P5J1_9BURK|nr:MotA/TolQ/ExbB proton channel family protein [Burkholderia metallica]MDN7930107.1 MotA/TolQ/ExbB proton channel family protein [Burkholderia metallica]